MLSDVQYIPSMKRNLISLGMLDSKGYWWSVMNGVLQVMAGDKVILEGIK